MLHTFQLRILKEVLFLRQILDNWTRKLYHDEYAWLTASTSTTTQAALSSPSTAATAAAASGPATTAATQASALSAMGAAGAGGQAGALGQYMAMYQQLAAQEYLKQLQSAARDPAAYAALASQGVLPNYEMLTGGGQATASTSSKGKSKKSAGAAAATSSLDQLRLPSDTEIIKYSQASATPAGGSGKQRGRKKTISADEPSAVSITTSSSSSAAAAAAAAAGMANDVFYNYMYFFTIVESP